MKANGWRICGELTRFSRKVSVSDRLSLSIKSAKCARHASIYGRIIGPQTPKYNPEPATNPINNPIKALNRVWGGICFRNQYHDTANTHSPIDTTSTVGSPKTVANVCSSKLARETSWPRRIDTRYATPIKYLTGANSAIAVSWGPTFF